MPNYKKFNAENANVIQIKPKGWNHISVEFLILWEHGKQILNWRVKGTEHIFEAYMLSIEQGKYSSYHDFFEHELEFFWSQILEWRNDKDLTEDWINEYFITFKPFIIT